MPIPTWVTAKRDSRRYAEGAKLVSMYTAAFRDRHGYGPDKTLQRNLAMP